MARREVRDDGALRCSGCKGWFTLAQLGVRIDGRPNHLCAGCRAERAALAGAKGRAIATGGRVARWEKALRIVERWCGMPHDAWATPAGREWQMARRVYLQELWSDLMRRLRDRDARAAAIQQTRAAAADGDPDTAAA